MTKWFMYVVICIVIVCMWCVPVRTASAETVIRSQNGVYSMNGEVIWDKEHGPYILESDVYVYGSLRIQAGVEVYGSRSQGAISSDLIIGNGGSLSVEGTADEKVTIHDLRSLQVNYGSEAHISYADISNIISAVSFLKSKGYIEAVHMHHNPLALKIADSEVSIYGSRITDNTYGIRIMGGYAVYPPSTASSSRIRIHHTVLSQQGNYSIKNDASEYVDAMHNWWGSVDGPTSTHVPSAYVIFDPWLMQEPTRALTPQEMVAPQCCSSILFIPGLKATRLYKDVSSLYGFGTTTDRLWDPTSSGDVRALYLDQSGKSIDEDIYVGAPIDSVFGMDIYGGFMDFLNTLSHKGIIQSWSSYGYDWRRSVIDVAKDTELLRAVQSLASSSYTGKVTLIAHSNGGLIMKQFVRILDDMHMSDMIDTVISVAVPYLGTPKAILSILHGYGESIAKGLIVRESVARGLGKNMISAYTLLPSLSYMSRVFSPTIVFASTTVSGIDPYGNYASMTNRYDMQHAFVYDTLDGRSNPPEHDVSRPIEGNDVLGSIAEYIHGMLDPFAWPHKIASYAIVGWGIPTASGITYENKKKCSGFVWNTTCEYIPVYSARTTLSGDGTVVSPSASAGSGIVISEDMRDESTARDLVHVDHADIVSASTTQAIISEIVSRPRDDEMLAQKLVQIPGVSIGEHVYGSLDTKNRSLVISTHSPVELHVYDTQGRHTGEKPAPFGTQDVYVAYDEAIPGSTYERTGDEVAPDTYIRVPDNGYPYSIHIRGTDTGEFSYRIERVSGGEVIDTIAYEGVPTTPLLVATTYIAGMPEGVQSLASSSGPLILDIDGNGSMDASIDPGRKPDPYLFLDLIRKTLESLGTREAHIRQLIVRIEHMKDMLQRGKSIPTMRSFTHIEKALGHTKYSLMNEEDRMRIIESIERYLSQ